MTQARSRMATISRASSDSVAGILKSFRIDWKS
jgi:hypothetical protein